MSIPIDSMIREGSTGVYVLEEGQEAITSRAYLSNVATKSIDIQYFIFSEDNIGIISCDYMLRAACHGVKVRVIVDDLMVGTNPDYILALDQHENIDIKIYNPNITINKSLSQKLYHGLKDFRGINQRMHHKTFIVDGKAAITGGRNIADEYYDFDHEYNFRDRDVLLTGDAVADLQNDFEKYWQHELCVDIDKIIGYRDKNYSPINLYRWIHEYAQDSLHFWPSIRSAIPQSLVDIKSSGRYVYLDSVIYYSDPPGKNEGGEGILGSGVTTDALINIIESAESSIYIQSPYLVSTEVSQKIFSKAIDRGVDIYILTNSLASTDNIEAFSGYQRARGKLLDMGVHIYEYRPDASIRKQMMTGELQHQLNYTPTFGLHAKSMIVDESVVVIGTFNLDPRSANLNTECIVVMHSTTLASPMLSLMKEELLPQNAWKVTPIFNGDSQVSKMKRIKTFTRRLIPEEVL